MTAPILLTALIQYQALAAPVLVPVPASTEGGGSWRTGMVPTIQYQAHTAPIVVPSQIVSPAAGASPVFPAQVFRRRSLHASQHPAFVMDVQWDAPGAVTVPELVVIYDSRRIARPHRAACYVIAEPEFGVPTEVPVMSWTGHFPDRLGQWTKTRHVRHTQVLAWDTVLGPLVVVAPDQAVPVYPDTVRRAPRVVAFPQPAWPPFVADVTSGVPISSWEGEYPERVRPRRSILTAQQQALAFWPQPIPVVAVSHLTGGRGYWVVPPHQKTWIVPPHKKTWVV